MRRRARYGRAVPDLFLIFTVRDTDQARVVEIVWQARAIVHERIE